LTRAHLALKKKLADENADAVAMNCLRRGMLKPCMSFSLLNSQLTPAACQNDLVSVTCQMLGKLLVDRPGFIHNICYEPCRCEITGDRVLDGKCRLF
jgi:L-fucose isomerase-like protein